MADWITVVIVVLSLGWILGMPYFWILLVCFVVCLYFGFCGSSNLVLGVRSCVTLSVWVVCLDVGCLLLLIWVLIWGLMFVVWFVV